MKGTKLKKCPFCGGDANLTWYQDYAGGKCIDAIICENCDATFDSYAMLTKEQLISKWNSRV